ncbi:hypothetical protein BFR75_11115 [Acinetobacter pittii]|uniref:hypothetical protein n=1 Tax=Acinetobacter pittii TaxID=48296 RepID=UPI00083958E9|nr:hypothetical protein [Acinetobacter pittii]OCY30535.1 hypothetical protein BFR75_11115 [Acinetobacter pittii]
MSQTEDTSKKFSKREWFHLIITLSIIQAGVWYISFQYASNASALGYISFAGTLISIILAILAIGYTYGESQQQKNSSATLANQLDSLVKIKDKLESQAGALEDIKLLKVVINEFSTKIESHFKETQLQVNTVNQSINLIAKNFSNPVQKTITINDFFLNAKNYENLYHHLVYLVVAIHINNEIYSPYISNYRFLEILDELQYEKYSFSLGITTQSLMGGCIIANNSMIFSGQYNFHTKFLDQNFINFIKYIIEKIQKNNFQGNESQELFMNLTNKVAELSIIKSNIQPAETA